MTRMIIGITVGLFGLLLGLTELAAQVLCPDDSVPVGSVCIDKYEASVWQTMNAAVIKRILQGKVTLADLLGAGVIQRGVSSDDYDAAGCPDTGNGCTNVYAVSIAGVTPSRFINWFQAAAAARNSGKRLPTNAEWQAAALGTPDGAPCVVSGVSPGSTGTAGCESDVGTFDMVGNVWEWVADWVPLCAGYVPSLFPSTGDINCLAGARTDVGPGAVNRGGSHLDGTDAGVFTVRANSLPTDLGGGLGFRAAR